MLCRTSSQGLCKDSIMDHQYMVNPDLIYYSSNTEVFSKFVKNIDSAHLFLNSLLLITSLHLLNICDCLNVHLFVEPNSNSFPFIFWSQTNNCTYCPDCTVCLSASRFEQLTLSCPLPLLLLSLIICPSCMCVSCTYPKSSESLPFYLQCPSLSLSIFKM